MVLKICTIASFEGSLSTIFEMEQGFRNLDLQVIRSSFIIDQSPNL